MERILSKEEIAELLSAVQQGEIETDVETSSHEAGRPVSRLDLVQTPGPHRWRISNLDIILEAFGRNYGISLTNRLQHPVSVEMISIDSMGFDDSLQAIPQFSAIGILSLDPFRTGGLLIFDDTLAFTLLEVQLGGVVGKKGVSLNRAMTAIEINLLRSVMEDSCSDLQKAFDPMAIIKPALLKIENNPRLVNIVTADSGVLFIRYGVTIEGITGTACLTIPHASLEPLREKLRDSVLAVSSKHSESWPGILREGVKSLEVEIAARVGDVPIKVRDILNFQVGDIIDLGTSPSAPIQVLVEGLPKLLAMAGTRNGNKAIRLAGKI